MLPWPQQRLSKKNIFLAKLCIFSSLIHIFLCFGLFFMRKSYKSDIMLNVHASNNAQDVIIRLLPLSGQKPVQKKMAGGIATKKIKTIPVKKKPTMQLAKLKQVVPKKVIPVKKAVVEKKIASNFTKALMDKKVEPVKKIEKKVAAVKPKEPEIKKVIPEKIASNEAVADKPKIEEKISEKKESFDATTDKLTSTPVLAEMSLDAKENMEREEENVRYVTHKELRGLQLEKALQQAVQEVWSPPIGIEETVISEVQVIVGWDGALVEKKVIKPTDIIIYDIAVQEALEEIKFPREVWGKEIKIAFRP